VTPQQLLRYQLALLLASSGRSRVLGALADLLKLSETELEAQIVALDKVELKKPARTGDVAPSKALEVLTAQHPDKADALRNLHARFLNKTFLADFRDVRRFMDSHSRESTRVKSRSDSLPALLRVLASLDSDELKNLCEQPESSSRSSLGIISDQILGRDKR
jgi:hypothetical protein